MEIIITLIIVALAIYILYKSIKKKSKGCTDCSSCSTKCNDNNIKFDKNNK